MSKELRRWHDAKIVVLIEVEKIAHLLTFNDQDFVRFPGITVLTPASVIASHSPLGGTP